MMLGLAQGDSGPSTLMIDATCKSGHAFLQVVGCEKRVEEAALVAQAFGQGYIGGAANGVLGGKHCRS